MSVILCIIDGFGIGSDDKHNAVFSSEANFLKNMMNFYPSCRLQASGPYVGLMEGQIGNSEIGHLTIGAGRIIENDLLRLNRCIANLENHGSFNSFLTNIKKGSGRCHLIGLLSDGGVHSHSKQIYQLIDYIKNAGIEPIFHLISDGRDVGVKSVLKYVLPEYLPYIKTAIGRYYAMDRDNRWERTRTAYELIVERIGQTYNSFQNCIDYNYANGFDDEFIGPAIIGEYDSSFKQQDGVIFANYRADRARQLSSLIVSSAPHCDAISLTKYADSFTIKTFIEPIYLTQSLGSVIADNNLKQLRIAETEKYAHVTYFFNGRIEQPMQYEERILVDSPKVATYDLFPQMSADAITNYLLDAIKSQNFDFILVNYANADMVGHTGNIKSAIKAIEEIDRCILKITELINNTDDTLIITSDHGNIEFMYDQNTGMKHTAHTLNLVPFVIIGKNGKIIKKMHDGSLCDIAPTMLSMMGLPIPKEMQGKVLIEYM